MRDETECLVARANARAQARAGPEGRIGVAATLRCRAPLRTSRDVSVPAFGRRVETFSLDANPVVLTPHQNGPGFSVQLRALPLDGRIVLLPPDGDDRPQDPKSR